jgi:hypothetical protein
MNPLLAAGLGWLLASMDRLALPILRRPELNQIKQARLRGIIVKKSWYEWPWKKPKAM